MWRPALVIVTALVPAWGWVWFFSRQDIYEREPVRLLLLCFFAGMLAVLPAVVLEGPFQTLMEQGSPGQRLAIAFFVVGLIEETLKLFAVYVAVFRRPEFDEIVDGMVYGMVTAFGFAAVENLLYIITFGLEVALARGIISSLAHGAFAGFAGYHLGLARFSARGRGRQLSIGLLGATFLHGLYNSLLLFGLVSSTGIIAFLALLYWLVFVRFRRALARSPHQPRGSRDN